MSTDKGYISKAIRIIIIAYKRPPGHTKLLLPRFEGFIQLVKTMFRFCEKNEKKPEETLTSCSGNFWMVGAET